MTPYLTLIARDLRLSVGRGSEAMTALFFFAVTASLFPFALGGEQAIVLRAAAGIIWVSAALASLLSLEALYHRDEEDGTFDLLMLSPLSPLGIALAKMLAHWTITGLALATASIVISQMLFVPATALTVLIPSLLLGTLYMSLLGGMGAVLTFGARRPGLLLALLILPLYIPMLILGVMGMEATLAGLPARAYLLLQLSMVIAALPLTAWVAAAFLRMNMRA
jgi:heme exporter protein B